MKAGYYLLSYVALYRRYRDAFAHAWRHRVALSPKALTEDEAAFHAGALSIQERPISTTARLTGVIICLLISVVLIWSIIGHIDIVVNAPGKVISSDRVKTVASLDTAKVRALHVSEGQFVRVGEVLIELDSTASDSERDKAIGNFNAAIFQQTRARVLIAAISSNRPPVWPSLTSLQRRSESITDEQSKAEEMHLRETYREHLAKLNRIDGDVDRYARELPLVARAADDYASLALTHDIPQHAWLEKEHARVDLAGLLASAKDQRRSLVSETRRAAYDQLAEANRTAAEFSQDAVRTAAHSRSLLLIAPVSGYVQQLSVHTVGGVVSSSQALMQIVPDNESVEVEATLENKDIGFVHEGQPAQVKVDAFQYTKYGTVDAKVTNVSRDAVTDEKHGLQYLSKITLNRSKILVDGKQVLLSPGMTVNVDIKTGNRRIIEFFLAPLLKHRHESLRER